MLPPNPGRADAYSDVTTENLVVEQIAENEEPAAKNQAK
jgi:hypothetical protein